MIFITPTTRSLMSKYSGIKFIISSTRFLAELSIFVEK